MANDKLFFVNIETELVKRFDLGKFLEFSEDAFDPVTSFLFLGIKELPLFGEYAIQSDEKKPDLISFNIYGDTQYWWLLLLYNGFTDPQELVTGTVLLYPDISDLEEFFFTLKTKEQALNSTV